MGLTDNAFNILVSVGVLALLAVLVIYICGNRIGLNHTERELEKLKKKLDKLIEDAKLTRKNLEE